MEFSRKTRLVFAIAALFIGVSSLPTLAVSSNDLVEDAAQYDGKQVVYRGEVIGDVMKRGQQAVFNVSDKTYAVGVWVPIRAAGEIRFGGRHQMAGDQVEVVGTFHRACVTHGGDMDIHAERLRVLNPGGVVQEPYREDRAIVAAALLVVALILVVWENRRRKPEVDDSRF